MENKYLTKRWLKCIKSDWIDENGCNIKCGDFVEIDSIDAFGNIITKGRCFSITRLLRNEFELMPIGFDPNNTDNFKLPEKWFLKLTNESVDYIKSYRDELLIKGEIKVGWFQCINERGYGDNLNNSETEITLDQFKKYVLKQVAINPSDLIKYNYEWGIMKDLYDLNHKPSYIDPYQTSARSNDSDYQKPLIIKNNKNKSKLIIINQ